MWAARMDASLVLCWVVASTYLLHTRDEAERCRSIACAQILAFGYRLQYTFVFLNTPVSPISSELKECWLITTAGSWSTVGRTSSGEWTGGQSLKTYISVS